ncbi:ImmA/IrrE family metallo-endopeptidase [Roseateles sp. UC29_93]|uniref:ImmA/IrrE family metallo-endopeptidase n=1 Tax=Roseateles sp. UC29_93 TaxID=3350177 RepID=UPI00366DBC98
MKSFAADTAELMNRMGAEGMQMQGDGSNERSNGGSNGESSNVTVRWPVDLSHLRPEDAAEWVVARYGDGAMPILPEKIAEQMGIRVCALADHHRHSVYAGPDGGLRIVIDTNGSNHRKRFAVAHGLGHILLRHEHPPLEAWNSFGNHPPDPRDHAANMFAASLLVPTEKLRWCVTSGWMRNVDHIVKTLWVPLELLEFRYQQLLRRR